MSLFSKWKMKLQHQCLHDVINRMTFQQLKDLEHHIDNLQIKKKKIWEKDMENMARHMIPSLDWEIFKWSVTNWYVDGYVRISLRCDSTPHDSIMIFRNEEIIWSRQGIIAPEKWDLNTMVNAFETLTLECSKEELQTFVKYIHHEFYNIFCKK